MRDLREIHKFPCAGSTPGPSDDTPLQSAVDVGRSSPAYSGSILGTTAASKMQSAAQQDLAQFFNRNTNSGRRGGRARKRGNPLQDLMEGERGDGLFSISALSVILVCR